jgi:hypothetical protein
MLLSPVSCHMQVCATKKVCRYHTPAVKEGMAALARAQEQQAATAHAAWQALLADFSAQHHATCRWEDTASDRCLAVLGTVSVGDSSNLLPLLHFLQDRSVCCAAEFFLVLLSAGTYIPCYCCTPCSAHFFACAFCTRREATSAVAQLGAMQSLACCRTTCLLQPCSLAHVAYALPIAASAVLQPV